MQRHSRERGALSRAANAVLRQDDDRRLGQLGDAGPVSCGALGEVVLRAADRADARRADAQHTS